MTDPVFKEQTLPFKEQARRAIAFCRLIAAMSEEAGRTTRRFLTEPVHEVHALLKARMQALAMSVHVDAVGNLRGVWRPPAGRGRRLVLGSHIDTVPDAGAFDGVLGVALALEWVELARELAFPIELEVIAFSEEEGVRFGVPFLGSRAVAESFDSALLALRDAQGVTVEECIRTFGACTGSIAEAALDATAFGFVEMHIEQGPVLEAEGLSIAVVSAIVGQTRLALTFSGQANHAGTTPMHLRSDALTAAAEWIGRVETLALETENLVATVGRIAVTPNAGNVIPGSAQVSLDIRHPDDAVRVNAVADLLNLASAIGQRRSLSLQCDRLTDQPATPMDRRLTGMLEEAISSAGFPVKSMPSGAGHDAMVMAPRVPTAMLFLRSPGGVSHHPDETVLDEDVEAALLVGRRFLLRLAAEVE